MGQKLTTDRVDNSNMKFKVSKGKFIPYIIAFIISLILGLMCGGYGGSVKNPTPKQTTNTSIRDSARNNSVSKKNVSLGSAFGEIIGGRYGLGDAIGDIGRMDVGLFFQGLFIPFFIFSLIIVFLQLSNQQNKDMRVGHEHGKEHIATPSDYKRFYRDFTDKQGDNILLSKHVAMSMDNKATNRTTNTLVIGGTGTGKTFRYIKPNIAQFNCSRVITDPSGDIFRSIGPALIELGKTVYLFNIKDFNLSNHYNPLLNVYDSNGNIDTQKVDILVSLYMENASEGKEQGSSDPFWDKSEKAFLTGVIYYVLENDDIPVEDKCFGTVLQKVQLAKPEPGSRDTTLMLTKEIDEWKEKMQEQGRNIMAPLYYNTFLIAPEKTMNTILITTAVDLQLFANPDVDRLTRLNTKYKDMNIDLDDLVQTETYLFLSIPQAEKAYNFLIAMIYSQLFSRMYALGEYITDNKWVPCKYRGLPLTNCLIADREKPGNASKPIFKNKEEVENLKNELSIEDNIVAMPYINNTKIYYLVWKNKILKKSLSKDAMERLVETLKAGKYEVFNTTEYWDSPALPMRVELMLDEFKNIGKIPNFDTIIATCRKYRIGVHVVIQDIAQLKELYPNESHQTILANTDITLFLGSKLPEDIEYIQKMVGKTTIKQKSSSGSKTGPSTSYTPTEVDVLSVDQIKAINKDNKHQKCIVLIRDCTPFLDDKLDFREHPNQPILKAAKGKIDIDKFFENNKENQII